MQIAQSQAMQKKKFKDVNRRLKQSKEVKELSITLTEKEDIVHNLKGTQLLVS